MVTDEIHSQKSLNFRLVEGSQAIFLKNVDLLVRVGQVTVAKSLPYNFSTDTHFSHDKSWKEDDKIQKDG